MEYMFLTCFADYAVNEYLLGAGPTTLTLAYDRMGEAHSYDLYVREHASGTFGPATSTPLQTEAEHQAELDRTVWNAESALAEMLEGYEGVLFLAPMGAHNAIAVEAWQVVAQWDLQMGEDGVVNAVRYGASEYDPGHSQPYTNLKSRIDASVAANATSTKPIVRIVNVDGLTQYYRDIGAYDDITPGDNATTTFTPSQPPSVPACLGVNGGVIMDRAGG